MPRIRFAERSREIQTNGITMRVHEDGPEDGVPIVFCHGFPELAFSWRHQVKGLGARGYRTIAPDLRGYGETDRTQDVADYRLANLCEDMAGLLEVLGIGKAVFVGHDLGGLLVYAMGVGRPDLCHGVVSLNTPYRPRPRKNPIQLFCEGRGGGFYMVTFQKAPAEPGDPRAGIAENVLGRDVRRTFRALMVVPQQCYAHYQALYPEVMELLPIGIFVGEPLLGELPVLSEEDLTTYGRAQLVPQPRTELGGLRDLGGAGRGTRAAAHATHRRARAHGDGVARSGDPPRDGRRHALAGEEADDEIARLRPLDAAGEARGGQRADRLLDPGGAGARAPGRRGRPGPALTMRCESCRQEIATPSRFCPECGAPTAGPRVERRQLTILFFDMVDYTTLAHRLDPEDVQRIMQAFHACGAAVLRRHGANIARYAGDGSLAYFGYPDAGEDDANRAVQAGL